MQSCHGEDSTKRLSVLLDKKYWEFFVPTILMAVTLTMSVVVDSIIVGNMLGANALAAVNLVMPVIMAYTTVAVCLGLGAATVISIAKGERAHDRANIFFSVALVAMVGLGVLMLVLQATQVDGLARLLTGEPTLRPLVASYLEMLVYGTPLIVTVPGLAYCLRVDGRVKLASTILIVSNVVNLILDMVYMGPLKMGIAGSSLATVSGYVVGSLLFLVYGFSKERTLRFTMQSIIPATFFKTVRNIMATGAPAALGSILITVKILCVNHIVVSVAGTAGMVAFSVCLSCLSFVSMFISGAAQAMTPIVGVLYGEKDHVGVRFVVLRAFKTLLIASVGCTLLLELIPGQVLYLFGVHQASDLAQGIPAIRIFSLSLVGTSITFLSMYYYMTVGQRALSTSISLVQGLSVVPVAFLLSRTFGVSGVWAAFSLAELVTITMIWFWCATLTRRQPELFNSPLLLDRSRLPQCSSFEMTCENDKSEIEKELQHVAEFLQSTENETMAKVHAIAQDCVLSIADHAYKQVDRHHVDVRINKYDKKVVVIVRDNGTEFQHDIPEAALRCELEHSRAIGFNNHILAIHLA